MTGGGLTSPCRPRLGAVSAFRYFVSVIILFIVLGLLYMVQTKQIQTFEITSDSMAPALQVGDRWLMTHLPGDRYRVGQMVVFRHPENPEQLVVKRIIARAGDRIQLLGGRLFVNGAPAPPPQGPTQPVDLPNMAWQVPSDHVFVAGDNRPGSTDSRDYGPIPVDLIEGHLEKKLGD